MKELFEAMARVRATCGAIVSVVECSPLIVHLEIRSAHDPKYSQIVECKLGSGYGNDLYRLVAAIGKAGNDCAERTLGGKAPPPSPVHRLLAAIEGQDVRFLLGETVAGFMGRLPGTVLSVLHAGETRLLTWQDSEPTDDGLLADRIAEFVGRHEAPLRKESA